MTALDDTQTFLVLIFFYETNSNLVQGSFV